MGIVLGITGGVATGKSSVLTLMDEMGAQTISADSVAREIAKSGEPAFHRIVEEFGEEVLASGELDRKALGRIVFFNEEKRKKLEEITHPAIVDRIGSEIERFRRESCGVRNVIACEIPLLFETGLQDMVDEVVVVYSEQDEQVRRLTRKEQMSEEDALARVQAQMPLDQKVRLADRLIYNTGDLQALRKQVADLWKDLSLS